MAGMQRLVTYIYAYENGQKSGNTGYAKIETRGNRGQIEIHFMNSGIYNGKATVSFLYVQNGKIVYFPIGEFPIEKGQGTGAIAFQTDVLSGTDFGFSKIDGILIVDSEKRGYLSFWKDVDITDFRAENFEEYSLDMPLPETIEEAEEESLHTMEIPVRNVFPTYTLEDIWQNFEKSKGCVQMNDEVCAVPLELSDLRELPKQYWYFGNNSFLLHGFFNYRHLLLGKLPDGRWFLGVPGVYERQERVMASIFGFPGFLHVAPSLGQEENSMRGDMPAQGNIREMQQGVWYHILDD